MTAGETVRMAHTKEIPSFYRELGSTEWGYRERNLTAEERNMADSEKNLVTPLKRKQEVPTYCLGKKRLLVKKRISHERRYNWTSRQAEHSENDFCDIRSLGYEEKRELIANIKEAVAFVTTMIFLDGSSQLNSEQVSELWVFGDCFAELFELCTWLVNIKPCSLGGWNLEQFKIFLLTKILIYNEINLHTSGCLLFLVTK